MEQGTAADRSGVGHLAGPAPDETISVPVELA